MRWLSHFLFDKWEVIGWRLSKKMHVSISAKSEERQIKNMKHWVKAIRGLCLCLVTCSSELVTQRKLSYSLCCLYDSHFSSPHSVSTMGKAICCWIRKIWFLKKGKETKWYNFWWRRFEHDRASVKRQGQRWYSREMAKVQWLPAEGGWQSVQGKAWGKSREE